MTMRKAKKAIKARKLQNEEEQRGGFTPLAERKKVDEKSRNLNTNQQSVFYFK